MNKGLLFGTAFSLLSILGCIRETDQPVDHEVKVSVSLASVQTKTYLCEEVEGRRQVYWSEGDAVNVNGYESLPLTAEQAGGASADFLLYNGTAPFNVIYPAQIYQGQASDGMITVKIPSIQEYSATSFGKDAAILYGYTESEDVPATLHNLCAAVKVTLNSSQTKISQARIISNSDAFPIAGDFCINPRSGEYTVTSGLTVVSLNISEVSLNDDGGQSFYFTVPHGTYTEGFTVKFYDAENYPMECVWHPVNGVVSAGKLYEFKPVDFVRGTKEILTGEDWKYIVEQINGSKNDWKAAYLSADNTIKLGADIVLPEGTPQITKSFPYVLDGMGYTITNDNATASLIKTLSDGGAIRNLTMAGMIHASNEDASLIEVSAFVHTLSGGKIEDCTNEMIFNVKAKKVIFGAFARTFSSGELNRCVNNADMTISMDVSSYAGSESTADLKSFGGGIVATCFQPTAITSLNGCINNGDLNITVKTGGAGLARNGYAGILGYVSINNKDFYPILTDCVNNGNVTFSFEDSSSKSLQYSLGGIVGLSAALMSTSSSSPKCDAKYGAISTTADHYYIKLENCVNTGRINNNATSSVGSSEINAKVYTGGIAGSLLGSSTNRAQIINCKNVGEVVPYSVRVNQYSRAGICGVCGGFLGLGGYVDILGGEMSAKVGSDQSRSFAAAGVIGLAAYDFSIKDMKVNANVVMIQSNDHTAGNHALAITNNTTKFNASLSSSEISGCSFAGSFLIASSAKYTDAPVVPTTVELVTADDILSGSKIVSSSYTKGAISLVNNTYWSVSNQ